MNIEENKEIIINNLKTINRDGIKDLLTFLEKSDFYTAPCSTKYHLNIPGGLVQHSLNVFKLFKEKVERYKLQLGFESVVICDGEIWSVHAQDVAPLDIEDQLFSSSDVQSRI